MVVSCALIKEKACKPDIEKPSVARHGRGKREIVGEDQANAVPGSVSLGRVFYFSSNLHASFLCVARARIG